MVESRICDPEVVLQYVLAYTAERYGFSFANRRPRKYKIGETNVKLEVFVWREAQVGHA